MTEVAAPRVGDRVLIGRDETLYPSKGTWPRFRSRTGTVVEINTDRKRRHLTEYGVAFGSVTPRTDRPGIFNWDARSVAWFKLYEVTVISRVAPVRHAEIHPAVGVTPG